MRKPLVALCSVLLLAAVLLPVQGQGRARSWKKGQLRMEDFRTSAYDGRQGSHLEYAVTYNLGGVNEGMNTYHYCRTSAVMYPADSWMAEGHRDENELTYNQALFDLVEVYRRQMQQQSYLLTNKNGDKVYDMLLENTMAQLEREVQVLQKVTDYGHDSVALERVRRINRQWLNDNPGGRPQFTPGLYWWKMGADMGIAVPTGGLARNFSASIGSMGFFGAFGWGRHGFYGNYSVGTVRYLNEEDAAYRNMTASRLDINSGYGFAVLDRMGYSITPYVAIGMTDFDWYYGDSYTIGVMGCYHFHHWHSIKNGVRKKASCLTVSAMGRLYASYINMDENSSGLTFGFQLGLTYMRRSERVEW